jgi:hypothetical protein
MSQNDRITLPPVGAKRTNMTCTSASSDAAIRIVARGQEGGGAKSERWADFRSRLRSA